MKIDKYSVHEVLHMCNFLVEAVHRELSDNEFIMDNPEMLKLANSAGKDLADLYQMIGASRYEFESGDN